MMLLIDGSDPIAAASSGRLLIYSYLLGANAFNKGPIPCSGLSAGFSYRTKSTGPFTSGGLTNACDSTNWRTRTADNSAYLANFNAAAYGVFWGIGMGGSDTQNHDGWLYVR
jgi:hypothetical protein